MGKEVRRVAMMVWSRVRRRGGRVPFGASSVEVTAGERPACGSGELVSCIEACCIMSSPSWSRLTLFSGGSSLSVEARLVPEESSFFEVGGKVPDNGIDGVGKSL